MKNLGRIFWYVDTTMKIVYTLTDCANLSTAVRRKVFKKIKTNIRRLPKDASAIGMLGCTSLSSAPHFSYSQVKYKHPNVGNRNLD